MAPWGPCRGPWTSGWHGWGPCQPVLCQPDTGSADGSGVREGGDSPVPQGTRASVRVSQHPVMGRQRPAGGQQDPPRT